MIRSAVAAVVLMVSTPVIAGPVLWNDLEVGMTKAEVASKYPTSSLDLSSGCVAKLEPKFRSDRLSTVVMRVKPVPDGLGGRKRCSDTVLANLESKYGAPIGTKTEKASTLSAGADTETTWKAGNVLIRHIIGFGNATTLVYQWDPVASTPDITSKL